MPLLDYKPDNDLMSFVSAIYNKVAALQIELCCIRSTLLKVKLSRTVFIENSVGLICN